MTTEEFLEIPPDGKRYELINGAFIAHPSPPPRHQRVLRKVLSPLYDHCRTQGGADALLGPLDVVLSGDSVVEPDGLVVCDDRAHIVGEKYVVAAPNIIVEILSNETRQLDEVVKVELYERAGVEEYWLFDPGIDVVKIYRRVGESFVRTETGGTITSPLLPGFTLDVNVVFDV